MATENQKTAIGSLLNDADQMSKKVISAYSPTVKYKTNMQNVKKFDAAHIEAAATFLGFKVRADNKKLYKNLQVLSDRVILKIESLFESTCPDCGETYCNSRTDTPPLTCYLCMQGSHDCSNVKDKIDPASRPPAGSVWLCFGCLKKNDLALSPNVTHLTIDVATTAEPDHSAVTEEEDKDDKEEEEEEEDTDERVSPRRDRDKSTNKDGPICEAYKKRKCPHGLTGKRHIEGKPCPNRHPPRCFRWCKHGDHQKLACILRETSVSTSIQSCAVTRFSKESVSSGIASFNISNTPVNTKGLQMKGMQLETDRPPTKLTDQDRKSALTASLLLVVVRHPMPLPFKRGTDLKRGNLTYLLAGTQITSQTLF